MSRFPQGAADESDTPRASVDLLTEIESCLARVRDHIYERNVGGLIAAASDDLFDLDEAPADGWQPVVVRAEGMQ